MEHIRIDVLDGGGPAAERRLAAHVETLPHGAPLVFATHGLRHSPRAVGTFADPHAGLLSSTPVRRRHWKDRSLLRGLHMGAGQRLDGHGVAFGWEGRGPIWPAQRRAGAAGAALARLCAVARARRPDLRVGAVAHSLGASVVLEAMCLAPDRAFDRVLFFAPAGHRAHAARALAAPGGRGAQVLAVQPRENWPFALCFALASAGQPTLARGPDHPAWRDLAPEDAPGRVRPCARAVCHWSGYLRAGLWPHYRAWMTGAATLGEVAPAPTPRREPAGAILAAPA